MVRSRKGLGGFAIFALKYGFWERFLDFFMQLQITSFYLSVHFGKKFWYSMISSINFSSKLARLSLSMSMAKSIIFSKPKTMPFDIDIDITSPTKLALSSEVNYFLEAKIIAV